MWRNGVRAGRDAGATRGVEIGDKTRERRWDVLEVA